jgi:tryptophanyl-tRNA synthetase
LQSKPDPFKGQVKDPNSKSQAKKMRKLEATNAKKALKAQEKLAALSVTEDMPESDGLPIPQSKTLSATGP